jgi:uncharacterized ferredoxin-like protein
MPRIQIREWPPNSPPDLNKKENVLVVARLMANAAMTAPITGGMGGTEVEIVYGEDEIEKVAREMERLAHHEVVKKLKKPFLYEAAMLRETDVIVFVGNFRAHSTPVDAACGLCGGEADCSFFYERTSHVCGIVDTTDRERTTSIKGPLCMLRAHDLGYAVASAVWIASSHFVDAKPCYSVGLAGRNLDVCNNSEVVVGIPIAALTKNPYVDVSPEYHLNNMGKIVDAVRKTAIVPRQLAMVNYMTHDPSKKSGGKKNEEEE